ncbi:hypothetical protein BJX96DRAFT_142793 [Aspergillus floccosus]
MELNLRSPVIDLLSGVNNFSLSQLSSSLVQISARISLVDLADILSYIQHSESSNVHGIGTPAVSLENTIGVVIEQSQVFLDILRRLKRQLMSHPSISSAESQCSYSEYWDEDPFALLLTPMGKSPRTQVGQSHMPTTPRDHHQHSLRRL